MRGIFIKLFRFLSVLCLSYAATRLFLRGDYGLAAFALGVFFAVAVDLARVFGKDE